MGMWHVFLTRFSSVPAASLHAEPLGLGSPDRLCVRRQLRRRRRRRWEAWRWVWGAPWCSFMSSPPIFSHVALIWFFSLSNYIDSLFFFFAFLLLLFYKDGAFNHTNRRSSEERYWVCPVVVTAGNFLCNYEINIKSVLLFNQWFPLWFKQFLKRLYIFGIAFSILLETSTNGNNEG